MAWKKRADETCGTSRMTSSPCAFFLDSASPLSWFFFLKAAVSRATKPAQEGNTYNRASRWPMMRFTWANLRVFLAMPIASKKKTSKFGWCCSSRVFWSRAENLKISARFEAHGMRAPRICLHGTAMLRHPKHVLARNSRATASPSFLQTLWDSLAQPHRHPLLYRCSTAHSTASCISIARSYTFRRRGETQDIKAG